MRSPDSARFCRKTACIGNGDDPRVAALLGQQTCRTVSYGLGQDNQWRPLNLRYDETGCAEFDFALAQARRAYASARAGGVQRHARAGDDGRVCRGGRTAGGRRRVARAFRRPAPPPV